MAGKTDKRLEPVVCPDCADIEIAMRVQADRDKAVDKAKYGPEPPPDARLAADGRRWMIRTVTAEEKAAEPKRPGTTRHGKTATPRQTGS